MIMEKAGIVCCSNGLQKSSQKDLQALEQVLKGMGLEPVYSPYLYAQEHVWSGTARQRAEALMEFYRDEEIHQIFDVSGGDLANGILPYLDYAQIQESDKCFWGYSDLTTVLNAIYTKTGRSSVLYQVRNLVYDQGERQQKELQAALCGQEDTLFQFPYEFLQGETMEGIVAGGNIRCFLKLAGTPYFPDLEGKILLLEALGGQEGQMLTYLSQLQQLGAFEKVRGILLGTFTSMESQGQQMYPLLKSFISELLPVARTSMIGHGTDAKAIRVGEVYRLKNDKHKGIEQK